MHPSNLCLHLHLTFSKSLCPGFSPLWINAYPNPVWPHLNLFTSTKTLFPKKVTGIGLTLEHISYRTQFNPPHPLFARPKSHTLTHPLHSTPSSGVQVFWGTKSSLQQGALEDALLPPFHVIGTLSTQQSWPSGYSPVASSSRTFGISVWLFLSLGIKQWFLLPTVFPHCSLALLSPWADWCTGIGSP